MEHEWPSTKHPEDTKSNGSGHSSGYSPGGVEVAIDQDRIDKLLKVTQQGLGHQGMVHNIRSLAGELSWVAGIIPSVRPFVHMIWAATYAMDRPQAAPSRVRKRQPDTVIFTKMVKLPFKWLKAFLEGNHGGLTRKRLLWDRHAPAQWSVRTDAPTSAGRHPIERPRDTNPLVGLPDT